jgi:RNA polymerase sigma-70 factor, ECF subfamily
MPSGESPSPRSDPMHEPLNRMDDRTLLAGLRAGNQAAFDTIFRVHYLPLVGFVQSILRERALAEEVVQDLMLELWRRRESMEVKESIRTYLFQGARNRSLNHIRHARVEERAEPYVREEEAVAPRADADVVEKEIEDAVRVAVGELPARCREVFELSRVHGLKYSEIAGTMGISVKTVETQMGKALQILRGKLAAWLPGSSREE